MKTKIKRHSRAVLSIVLTLCMLVSCMTVGIIATDAAKTADQRVGAQDDNSDGVGATEYLILSYNSNNITSGATYVTSDSKTFTLTASNFGQSSFETGKNYFVGYSSSNSYTGISKGGTSAGIGTKDSGISGLFVQDYSGYKFVGFSLASTSVQSVTVTVSGDAPYTYSMTSSTSGGGGGESGGGDEPSDLTTASKGGAPVRVLVGTDIMFYISSYNGTSVDLCDSTPSTPPSDASSKDDTTANKTFYSSANIKEGDNYVQVTKTSLSSYNRITNNLSGNWNGQNNQSTNISNATGGELFWDKGTNGKTNATSCTTTIAPASVIQGGTITFSTTCEKTKMSHGDQDLYYQYYIDNETTPIAVASGKDSIAASGTTAQDFVLSSSATSALSVGSHTLKTVATDGGVYYISDTDTFTVTAAETKHAVTISASPSEGGTITPATGTEVGESTATTITATPSAGYEFSSWTLGTGIECSDTSSNAISITTKSSGTYTVQANFTAKPTHTITVTTNNPAYGTASASVASAYQGQEVTLTATESTGTFSNWTVNSGSVTVSGNTKSATFTMGSSDVSITANFTEYTTASPFYYNSYGSNGQPAATHYGAQMTEAKISGETFSYYHVQGRDENDQLFTVSYQSPVYEGYYAFFEIWNDWENNKGVKAQFYATDGNNLGDYADMAYEGSSDSGKKKKFHISIPDGARKVEFKCVNSGYTTGKLNLYDGKNGWYTKDSMTDLDSYAQSLKVPVNFYENFNGTNKYTNAFSTKGFNSHYASRGESHAYTKPKGLDSSTKGDYYIVVLYENKTYTINGVTKTISNDPEIIWMSELPTAVEDTTETVDIYAKNGTLRDSTFNRFTNLADTDFDTTYFEYTESLDSGVVTYNSIADYNAVHSKKITYDNAVSGYNSDYAIMKNVPIGAKIKIKTTLSDDSTKAGSFNNEPFKDTHYLKAYSFNGMTYEIHSANDTGVYEEIWTVRDVNTKSADGSTNLTKDGKSIEVTPIYYMKDNTNCKTFYIDGYDGTVQNAWGNMLCVYPYYENKSNSANAFGGYPGQPMLFWGGKYQMEIPLTVDGTASGASVKGLTLHNGYWDLLHRSLDIRCNDRNHAQTYDYDDFYKLYKEKNPDTIIFDFKYRTQEDHYSDGYDYTNYTFAGSDAKGASDFTGSSKNGVEIVTDYFGRQVDAFGTLIADANKSRYGEDNGSGGTVGQSNEILFVSTGFKDTYVGEYATLWAVYAPQTVIPSGSGDTAGKFIGYISSSMLYLNNWERRLQYTGGDSTADGRMSWTEFENTYKHLKDYYTGVPALISYEKEIWNDSKDKAYRSDGKWYYSNKSDKISASIKIQYGAYSLFEAPDHSVSSDAWSDDPFDENETGVGGYKNIGTRTECAAYFTNTTPNLLGKVASGEQFADSTKKFTFQAVPSGSYMFAGWVRYSNGKYYEITENEIGESPMSANDVYIARFVTAKTGTLTIQHVVEQTNDFNGTGTPSLTVTVKDGSGNNVSGSPFTVSDGSKIDISKWIDSHFNNYTIDISLTTTPTNESFMKNITSSSGNYAASPNTWNASYDKTNSSGADTAAKTATVAQFTVQQILDSGITSLRYVSHLMKPVYTYQYEIVYTYTSRFWGAQSYTQTGTCEDGDFTGSKTTATLNTDFIIGKTPYEKNFRQEINWNYTTSAVGDASAMTNTPATAVSGESNTYKMTAHVYSSNTVNDRVTAEFILPYYYNGKDQDYSAHVADVYNSASDAHDSYQGHTYLYDTSHESVTLDTQAYKLFTTDDQDHSGSDDTYASSLHLIEAAPYLMMDGSTEQTKIQYHYMLTDNMRYYTGNSFTVNGTTYYKDSKDIPAGASNYQLLTGSNSVTFTKIKYKDADPPHTTTYHYAVEDTTEGAKGQPGYKIYFFSYVTNDEGDYLDNNGNSSDTPVFNGQYCVYSVGQEKDGIIQGTGVKKYFTRWDIYNTKGDFVASCYNRRFNYSGYDNYVVRPIYESDTEQDYSSSAGLDNTTLANITYLGDTRNQWNNGAKGDYATVTGKTDGNTAGDKLIHDFALAYAYNGLEISQVPSTTAEIKIGMIIEQLDALDSAGGTKITDSSYYAEKYNKSSNAHRPEVDMPKIKNWLEGKAGEGVKLSTYLGHTCINSKIGNNVDDNWGQKFDSTPAANSPTNKMSFNSVIDNFNRLQWFYTFTNTKTGEGGTIGNTNNANYAYRAWAYIIVDGTATVSSTPVYFTLYDSASR